MLAGILFVDSSDIVYVSSSIVSRERARERGVGVVFEFNETQFFFSLTVFPFEFFNLSRVTEFCYDFVFGWLIPW